MLPALQSGRFWDQSSIYTIAAIGRKAAKAFTAEWTVARGLDTIYERKALERNRTAGP
jgi:hypothetical protein